MVTLQASKPFRMLSPGELNALRHIAQERRYATGEVIFKEGDSGDGVFLVRDGLVEISVSITPNERKVFAQVNPGELFGEMAVLEFKPRSATATSVRDSMVYFIPRDELLVMVEHSPALSLELLREVSQRLRDFNDRYVQEVLQTERLAVIGRFARSIIHDLKNPLNIIGLTAEMSGMENASMETRQKAVVTISQQVERVSEMISEILDFTQGSHAGMILSPADYGAFVQKMINEIRPEVELRETRIDADEPPSVQVPLDARRLRRVFYNLIHNATEAMPDGGRILMRFFVTESELVTEIEDTGPGIPPEMAGRLFEAFATHGKAHGTGLGLSICKKIIEDHRGRIWTRSQPGRGAIFAFSLPLPQ
jgi:signal transduction histidine kinase